MTEVRAWSVQKVFKSMITPQFIAVSTTIFLGLFFLVSSDRFHRNIYYLFVLIPFLAVLFRQSLKSVLFTRTIKITLVFFAYLLLSLFWSDGINSEVVFNILRKELITVCFVLVIAWLWQQGYRHYLLFGLIVGAFFGAWLSIYHFYFVVGHGWGARLEGIGRGEHAIKSPVMYGTILIMLLGLLTEKQNVKQGVRLFMYSAMFSYLVFILLSQTRGVLISVSAAFFFILVLRKQYKQVTALVMVALLAIIYAYVEGYFARMMTLHDVRYDIWIQALQYWLEHPWFGYGIYPEKVIVIPSGASFVHPHNIFVSHLLYGGLIALFLLLCLLGSLFYSSWKLWREKSNVLPLGLCVYFLFVGMFDFSTLIRSADVEWIFFWLLVAIVVASEIIPVETKHKELV